MTLGDKLRQLRNERELTQPALAEALGIEQSYLSKLENDRSLPSNGVFARILEVFELDLGALLQDLEPAARNRMRQIPDVAEYYRHRQQQVIGNQKRWLILSALLLASGLGLIYAGQSHLFFPNVIYQYKSHGIVLQGEPKEIFLRPHLTIPDASDHAARVATTDAIKKRTNEVFLTSGQFRGQVFNVPVEGGSRTYYLTEETEVDPWQSKLVVFFGVIFSVLGLFGVFLERKLSRAS